MKRRFQFEFLRSRGLRSDQRLLDIGCGTLRGGIPLIDYLQEGGYVGIEARANVLDEGRKELREAGLDAKRPILIHAADLAEVRLETPVDVAWAFSVLIHMTDEIADTCMDLVDRSLTSDGEFYANVQVGERSDRKWFQFPLVSRPHEFYVSLAADHGLEVSDLGTLHALGHRSGSPAQDGHRMLRFTRARPVAG
jgi:cyclopropane fatty-acyl-phospholipid synthase-like methyltransferase